MNIYALHQNDLDSRWLEIAPFIEKGLDYCNNEMDILDAHTKIEEGDLIPLVIEEDNKILSVVTLEMVNFPKKRVLGITTAGGTELDVWLDQIMTVIDAIAKEQQADSIDIVGRKGWIKMLDKYNYKYAHTVLSKEVN